MEFIDTMFDQNGDGFIDRDEYFYMVEYVVVMQTIEAQNESARPKPIVWTTKTLITDHMREQLPEELLDLLSSADFKDNCMASFDALNFFGDGKLDSTELQPIIVDLLADVESGPPLTQEQSMAFVKLVFDDQNEDGKIERDEWFRILELVIVMNVIES